MNGSNLSQTVQNEVTIIIKTFERPQCVTRLVKSIRQYYQEIPIIVADDSRVPLSPIPEEITNYYHLPFDSGMSYGRNFGLDKVKTKYFLLADDDMIFKEKTKLEILYTLLESTSFSLTSCNWVDHLPGTKRKEGISNYCGISEINNGVHTYFYGKNRGYKDGYPIYDVVHNFFMANVADVGPKPWDDRIKISGHPDFFLRLKKKGVLCTKSTNVFIYHYPGRGFDYMKYRYRDLRHFFEIYFKKHGIKKEVLKGSYYRKQDYIRYFYNHYDPIYWGWYFLRRKLAHRASKQMRIK